MERYDQIPPETVMTASEVAKLLKVSVVAVRRWTREGSLKGYRLGGVGDWRYIRKDVVAFLLGEKNNP
ncbi:MAG: helix-turn-helix domain-containing protein [Crenarchaeota archaeon]|nr:helix-turn-helix domain-containing protein [Thermoproteota archaeon]